MSQIPLTFEQAVQQFPEMMEELVGKIRSSKSHARNDDLESFTWSVQYYVRGKALSIKEVLQQKQRPRPTVEEKVQQLRKDISVNLVASKKQRGWTVPFTTVPEGIIEKYRADFEQQEADYKRAQALPPEERTAETQKILKQLGGSPGFAAFQKR